MNLKIVSICIVIVSIFMFGCSKKNDSPSDTSSSLSAENEDNKQNKIEELKEKLSKASNYGESNPIERTMDESIEYAKSNLPEGIKEVKSTFNSDNGTTQVIYEENDMYFRVTYMHPFKEDGNNVDEYDLEKTVGITLWMKESLDK
ncbi:hypothetical protein [Terrisporobacter vanillatitrophus]|uniref:hypothetical protein n=1 Tax=Terrisporobacter vanillatitrophus TaxID=3058402 RepID=UPI003368D212